jgi:hypothetical protein
MKTPKLTADRISILVGVLFAGVVTRFMEDGNLLITSVFTIFCGTVTRVMWAVIKKFSTLN